MSPHLNVVGLSLATVGVLAALARGQCEHVETLVAADGGGIDDHFGYPVAIHGDVIVVGAHLEDASGLNSGAAYVFEPDGAAWGEPTPLVPSDPTAGVQLGNAVAAVDGHLLVSAWLDSTEALHAGAVHVFAGSGGTWEAFETLTASNADVGAYFGSALAAAGDLLVVGAFGSDALVTNGGAAYVFRRRGGTWVEEAELLPETPWFNAQFGIAVATDGTTIVVGANFDGEQGINAGAAYVFRFDGEAWVEEAKLAGADTSFQDQFGLSVAVRDDLVLVGAPRDDDAGSSSGSAYLFGHDGGGWSELGKSVASDGQAGDEYGSAVAIGETRMLVGAHQDDDCGSELGAIYVLGLDETPPAETCKLLAPPGGPTYGHFGISVAIDGDVVVGGGTGVACVFDLGAGVTGDLDGDGDVDVLDLVVLITSWGECAGCAADLDGDGIVGVLDLVALLVAWG